MHVFISYVRENQTLVDHLCNELRARGIEPWLDRERITPGQKWPEAIEAAIKDGAFFLACFSPDYNSRNKTFMNEELTLAIDQIRQRHTDRIWFIPLRLEDCSIPDRRIGGGETLRDLQWVDLFTDWEDGIQKLVNVMRPTAFRNLSFAPVVAHVVGNPSQVIALTMTDITSVAVEVIVNPTSAQFGMRGEVGSKILAKGGARLQATIEELRLSNDLDRSRLVVSNAGDLPSRYIFHVPGVYNRTGIHDCLHRVLSEAENRSLKEIAVPALGTGNMQMTREESADSTISAIQHFFRSTTTSMNVYVAVYSGDVFQVFEHVLVRPQSGFVKVTLRHQ